MASEPVKVTVTFTEQQLDLLEKLVAEERWGDDVPQVVSSVFHEYVRAFLGRGGQS